MANKKLTAEVELKTDKAKRQLQELGTPGSSGGGADASGASHAASRLSMNLNRAADSAVKLDRSSLSVVKAFTGLGVGLAANYAASHMKQGAARDAVEYGASAVSGAGMGAAAGSALGPAGTIVGALLGGAGGLIKTFFDKDAEKIKNTEDWQRSEHDYQNNKAFADFYRGLTDLSDKGKSFADRISEAEAELKELKDVEPTLKANVDGMIEKGEYEKSALQRGYLGINRQRQQQLENDISMLRKQSQTGGVPFYAATDALAKFGGGNGKKPDGTPLDVKAGTPSSPINGSFFFGGPRQRTRATRFFGNEDPLMKTADDSIAILEKEGNDLLKQIAENTKRTGGGTWR